MKLKTVKEIAKFLKESSEELLATEDQGGCCSMFIDPYDHTLSLSVGWMSGYDEDPGDDYASKKDPTWRINAAIVKYNPYDCAELEYMDQPWNKETGDVWDTMFTVSRKNAKGWLAEASWFKRQYMQIVKAIEKGEVVYE